MAVILRPEGTPYHLLNYSHFDQSCAYVDRVCEIIEERSGLPAKTVLYTMPQVAVDYLNGVEFEGPMRHIWECYKRGCLPASFEVWPKRGPCPGLYERCPCGPGAFLRDPRDTYRCLRECLSITKRARELGVELWQYTSRKRVYAKPVVAPVDLLEFIFRHRPISYIDAANCGLHGLASLIYWAQHKAIKSVEDMLTGRNEVQMIRFTKLVEKKKHSFFFE